jgi:hypothetical protein
MNQLKLIVMLMLLVALPTSLAISGDQTQSIPISTRGINQDTDIPIESTEGWLILNGELIPGPYDIVIEDDNIKINGLDITASPQPQKVITVEPSTKAQHAVYEALREAFPNWVASDGLDAARLRALEYVKAQPIVENVYMDAESDLRVLFKGEKYEDRIFLDPPIEDQPSPKEVRQNLLNDYLNSLKYWLTNGCLVIINEGVLMATPPLEGQVTL